MSTTESVSFWSFSRVTQVLDGQRTITVDTALRLGHNFGTSAEC